MERPERQGAVRRTAPPRGEQPAPPRRKLSPQEKKARDKAIKKRVKEKRKQAKLDQKLQKKREKALRKKHKMIANQSRNQRAAKAMYNTGGLPDGHTPRLVTLG